MTGDVRFGHKRTSLPPKADIETGPLSASTRQLRQLGDIRRDPPRLVFGEQSHSTWSAYWRY
jgi:hypothetical protein